MVGGGAPGRDRSFIAEEAERQDLAGRRQAFEAFNRDEPVDRREVGLQRPRDDEIGIAAAVGWLDLENHRDHRATRCRNSRSSRRMNRSFWAIAKFSRAGGCSRSRARYASYSARLAMS